MNAFLIFFSIQIYAVVSIAYPGGQCNGITFDLADRSYETLEEDLSFQLDIYPPWKIEACAVSVRKFLCMTNYIPYSTDNEHYCLDSCLTDLSECDDLFALMSESVSPIAQSLASIELYCYNTSIASDDSTCIEASQLESYPKDSPLCPDPLGLVPKHDYDDWSNEIRVADPSACAIPCPTVYWAKDEWETHNLFTIIFSFVGFLASTATMLSHIDQEGKFIFVAAFSGGNALTSLMHFLFTSANYPDGRYICRDGVVFRQKTPLCYADSILGYFGYIWVSSWSICIAVQLFSTVVMASNRIQRKLIMRYCIVFAVMLPVVCTCILAGLDQFGYDIGLQIPVCFLLQFEDRKPLYILFLGPNFLLVGVCMVFLIYTLRQLNIIIFKSKKNISENSDDSSHWKAWKKMLWFNQRSLAFIVTFCCLVLFVSSVMLQILENDALDIRSGVEAYARCLLQKSALNPFGFRADPYNYASDLCGGKTSEPTPDKWKYYIVIAWISSFGVCTVSLMTVLQIVPYLIYGTRGKLSKLLGLSKPDGSSTDKESGSIAVFSLFSCCSSCAQAPQNTSKDNSSGSKNVLYMNDVTYSGRISSIFRRFMLKSNAESQYDVQNMSFKKSSERPESRNNASQMVEFPSNPEASTFMENHNDMKAKFGEISSLKALSTARVERREVVEARGSFFSQFTKQENNEEDSD